MLLVSVMSLQLTSVISFFLLSTPSLLYSYSFIIPKEFILFNGCGFMKVSCLSVGLAAFNCHRYIMHDIYFLFSEFWKRVTMK